MRVQLQSILSVGVLLCFVPVYLAGALCGVTCTFFVVGWRHGTSRLTAWLARAV